MPLLRQFGYPTEDIAASELVVDVPSSLRFSIGYQFSRIFRDQLSLLRRVADEAAVSRDIRDPDLQSLLQSPADANVFAPNFRLLIICVPIFANVVTVAVFANRWITLPLKSRL